MDDHDPHVAAANSGLEQRFEYTTNGNTVTLTGSLHIDFLRQKHLLLNQVAIPSKLCPNKLELFLMTSDADYTY